MKETQTFSEVTEQSLFSLKEGNKRYLENDKSSSDKFAKRREDLANGQSPFATVLCCADSRVTPEIIFDQNLGNLFVIRNAGNVVDDSVLGSIEYASGILNIPLIVVCGHSHCGAITASYEKEKMQDHLNENGTDIPEKHLDRILSMISDCSDHPADVHSLMIDNIKGQTEILKENLIVQEQKTHIIGAYYDIITGNVIWI